MTALLELDRVEVRYGAIAALREVSFQVAPGETVALLGANGAGKTTLLKSIIGLLNLHAGSLRLDGRPFHRLSARRRARLGLGYCPEGRRTFPGLTVRENLLVACWESARERERRVDEMMTLFPALRTKAADPAWTLSGGQQQMLAIARSVIGHPRLLLLDEPSLGLSPVLTDEVIARIPVIAARGAAVLLAEQNAAKALSVCRRALVLQTGRVVAEGDAATLANSPAIRKAFLGG